MCFNMHTGSDCHHHLHQIVRILSLSLIRFSTRCFTSAEPSFAMRMLMLPHNVNLKMFCLSSGCVDCLVLSSSIDIFVYGKYQDRNNGTRNNAVTTMKNQSERERERERHTNIHGINDKGRTKSATTHTQTHSNKQQK